MKTAINRSKITEFTKMWKKIHVSISRYNNFDVKIHEHLDSSILNKENKGIMTKKKSLKNV